MSVATPGVDRYRALLHECKTHRKRVVQAHQRIKRLFPLDADTYVALEDEQVAYVDQLVYRYTKLQDVLGAKLYPAILAALREDAASMTVFDMLSELEKAGVVPSTRSWLALRETRNQLAHDYQDDPKEGSEYLNRVFDSVDSLLRAAEQAESFVQERVIPSLPETPEP
jgi:hypothetical protein